MFSAVKGISQPIRGVKNSRTVGELNEPLYQRHLPAYMISLNFTKTTDGLLPAIVQDYQTNEVLMLAYINKLAWEKTLETGKAHYWSRSRNKLWLKGETSGHVQKIHQVLVDCDDDTVVYKVEQLGGAACHTGHRSCFYRQLKGDKLVTKEEKVFDPAVVYGKK